MALNSRFKNPYLIFLVVIFGEGLMSLQPREHCICENLSPFRRNKKPLHIYSAEVKFEGRMLQKIVAFSLYYQSLIMVLTNNLIIILLVLLYRYINTFVSVRQPEQP